MSNSEILRSWYDRVWVQADLDAIDLLFAPDTLAEGMMEFAVGPEDFKALVPAFLAHVTDLDIALEKTIETGDWVWAHVSVRALSRTTGAPVHITGQIMARLRDGIIVEAYNQYDFLGLFEQLNLLPPDTLALCLSGEGVGV